MKQAWEIFLILDTRTDSIFKVNAFNRDLNREINLEEKR